MQHVNGDLSFQKLPENIISLWNFRVWGYMGDIWTCIYVWTRIKLFRVLEVNNTYSLSPFKITQVNKCYVLPVRFSVKFYEFYKHRCFDSHVLTA